MGKILAAGQPGAFFERLERILEKAAYKVCTAHDISSAANLLDQEILIDLIVLTDFAETEDNYLLLGKIRQDPGNSAKDCARRGARRSQAIAPFPGP